jgi:hypothetical protein
MKRPIIIIIAILAVSFIFPLSNQDDREISEIEAQKHLIYKSEIRFESMIGFRPRSLSTGGCPTCQNCLKGNYLYRYETDNGLHEHEVLLCCVPINELLSDSFHCADSSLPLAFASIFGDSDYIKVRYCHLLHPTLTEPILIPVCIPAPLTASIGKN